MEKIEIVGLIRNILRLQAHLGAIEGSQKRSAAYRRNAEDAIAVKVKVRKLKHRLDQLLRSKSGDPRWYQPSSYAVLTTETESIRVIEEIGRLNRKLDNYGHCLRILYDGWETYDSLGNLKYSSPTWGTRTRVAYIDEVFSHAPHTLISEWVKPWTSKTSSPLGRPGCVNPQQYYYRGGLSHVREQSQRFSNCSTKC